jgi:hypothetical protein
MDVATIDDLLTTTRSVRKRLDVRRPVEPEVLERCIEIATEGRRAGRRDGQMAGRREGRILVTERRGLVEGARAESAL